MRRPAPVTAETQAAMFQEMATRYPNILEVAMAAKHDDGSVVGQGCDDQFEFEFALDLLLDGFGRFHDQGWTSKRAKLEGSPGRRALCRIPNAGMLAFADGRARLAARLDPAIRWQVLRDLTDAPASEVRAERARVATEGWGARLLALQDENGQWDGGTYFPSRSTIRGRPALDCNHVQPVAVARFRARPPQRRGLQRRRPRPRQQPLGGRRPAFLRRGGGAVRQRHGRDTRRLLR